MRTFLLLSIVLFGCESTVPTRTDTITPSEMQVVEAVCEKVPKRGCCKSTHVAVGCIDGAPAALPCGELSETLPYCGWDEITLGYYCASTPGKADPSGTYPFDCP